MSSGATTSEGNASSAAVGELIQLLTAAQFRSFTRPQLAKLAEEDGMEVPSSMSKKELVALVKELFSLEDLWAEQREEKEHQERLDKERERQEKEERDRQFESERKESEQRFELERLRLEVERVAKEKGVPPESAFNLGSAQRLLPQFNEEEVDVFFDVFERVATELAWPRAKWPLLVQRALIGKAQHAFAVLDGSLALDYDAVKEAVLTACGSVPDEYRRKFRAHRRKGGESHLDLNRRQQILMARWLSACKADNVGALTELFLMEQFRSCLSRDVEVYIAERGVQTVKEAAELADTWEVIHFGGVGRGHHDRGQDNRKLFVSPKPEVRRSGSDRPGPHSGCEGGKFSQNSARQVGGS